MQPTSFERLRAEAMQLPDTERAELANSLWSSVTDSSVIEQAWSKEIERRVADLDAGRTVAISASTVFEEAEQIIARHK
jgi:putative addiction module component (TIGR02574 family)